LKKTLLIITLILITLLPLAGATPATATIARFCPAGTDILLKISALTNAHAELYNQDHYDYKVCSPFTSSGATRTCNGNNLITTLSTPTNAHAGDTYETEICYGDIICEAKETCSTEETCLLSLSDTTNAHVAECGFYDYQLCCSMTTTEDLFPDDPCSLTEPADACGTAACPATTPLCKTTCGDEQTDLRESCATCYLDNGCNLGKTCCYTASNPAAATCATTCPTGTTTYPGPGCDLGLKKNTQGQCICNTLSDNYCPAEPSCQATDPDCAGDLFPDDPCSLEEFGDMCGTPACPLSQYTTFCGPTCGDATQTTGESCATCYVDAGCSTGTTCCYNSNNPAAATCATTCPTGTTTYPGPGCGPGMKKNTQGQCICNPVEDNICSTDSTCQTNDPDCTNACDIQTATWSKTQGNSGEVLQLSITTTQACNDKQATFAIYEDDIGGDFPDDESLVTPQPAIVSAGKATTTWAAEYVDDGFLGGDPEYYFEADIILFDAYQRSSILTIKQSTTGPTCGNEELNTGENCFTCSEDAGCTNNKLCCSTGTTGTCKNSCSTGETPYSQGCAPGYDYDDLEEVCLREDDGDDLPADEDNCPFTDSNDDADFDNDGDLESCEFGIVGLGDYGIRDGTFCGGDVCDLDQDNDGICDLPGSVPEALIGETRDDLDNGKACFGEDQCLTTPSGFLVDDDEGVTQGCGTEESTCLVQWDCTNIPWTACTNGLRTRNIGDCSETGIQSGACQCDVRGLSDECELTSSYRPPAQESCAEAGITQDAFPFYTWYNLLISVLLLTIFYRRRR